MIKPKNIKNLDFAAWKNKALKDPEFKTEYERQEPEFAAIKAILEARKKNDLSQKELAQKIGTKQSVISRLESGNANPSIAFLQKLAEALNSRLVIKFIPR